MNLYTKYPLLARSPDDDSHYGFTFQGMQFTQDSFHIFAGLNAVDNPHNVELTFKTLAKHKLTCARMGAFKPRTSPYNFQGLGAECLPYVFASAATHNIKIIAMEITHEAQLTTIHDILIKQNNPTKIFVQVGTRNAQNFELLKALGQQNEFPILFKRGFGITLEESVAACEYLAHYGNQRIIFCLRGMKSQFAFPHRNFVDFAHVPTIKRLTKMPVCVDPSHAVGNLHTDLDHVADLWHALAMGVIAGANMLLIDVHPDPKQSPVDPAQAIALENLPLLLEDIRLSRQTYLQRKQLHLSLQNATKVVI